MRINIGNLNLMYSFNFRGTNYKVQTPAYLPTPSICIINFPNGI